MTTTEIIIIVLACTVIPVLLSFVFDALRPKPVTPEKLYWSDDIAIQYATVNGLKIRYIKSGQGPALVLLHTLRTQLDIFEKIIPELSRDFTVYALDYPGHGFSDIPRTDYVPDLFVKAVEDFLQQINITDATLAGVSIGGTIPLLIAAKHNPGVKNVISINPYDYGAGRGVERGNFVAWLVVTLSRIPIVGETVMRFRNPMVERIILNGGVSHPNTLTNGFVQQVWDSGKRPWHYRGFINLIRNAHLWENAHTQYANIKVPVTLIYGEVDWSREEERQQTHKEIPGSVLETVSDGGHFLTMDQPEAVIKLIRQYA